MSRNTGEHQAGDKAGFTREQYLAEIRRVVRGALDEDLGTGDVTSAMFNPAHRACGRFLAKQDGVVSGMEAVRAVFAHLDSTTTIEVRRQDGEEFCRGEILVQVTAPARVLLSGERVALNLLQRLSGVATMTRRFVSALGSGSPIQVLDTRKTTPLLRLLEKAAVVHGGGRNHRMRLDDMAMIKNNHVDGAGGVLQAVAALRSSGFFDRRPPVPLCIEARNQNEALQAVDAGADIVLLDNMPPRQAGRCAEAIALRAAQRGIRRPLIEVSGGITLARIGRYRDLPIDRISIGALTHSAPALDISLRISDLKVTPS